LLYVVIAVLAAVFIFAKEIDQQALLGSLSKQPWFQRVIKLSMTFRGRALSAAGDVLKNVKPRVMPVISRVRAGFMAQLKRFKKYIITVLAIGVAAGAWSVAQVVLVNSQTPEAFVTAYWDALDAKDAKLLDDPRYFADAKTETPVAPQYVLDALEIEPIQREGHTFERQENGDFRVLDKSGRWEFSVAPVDRFVWGYVERTWQIKAGNAEYLLVRDLFRKFDEQQVITVGSREMTLGSLLADTKGTGEFRLFSGLVKISVAPLGLNAGLAPMNVYSAVSSATAIEPAVATISAAELVAAKKVADALIQECIAKEANTKVYETCDMTDQMDSDDIASSIKGESPLDDPDVVEEISNKWKAGSCVARKLEISSATQGLQHFHCVGYNIVETKISGNVCYKKYSSWLGIYIDGCWSSRTDYEVETTAFRADVSVALTLDLSTNKLTVGPATGVAMPPVCRKDAFCG
jgi:hypothetical protein